VVSMARKGGEVEAASEPRWPRSGRGARGRSSRAEVQLPEKRGRRPRGHGGGRGRATRAAAAELRRVAAAW
jgi:hypothetical protein